MKLYQLIPFFDTTAADWAIEARLLRWLTFIWLFIGLLVLFSASYPGAESEFGDGLYYVKRQVISVVIGLVGFNIMVHSELKKMLGIAHWGVLILLGLIYVTIMPGLGTTVNGATRWLTLGSFPIQPSELIKPFLILQSAKIFGNWNRLPNKVKLTWLGIFMAVLLGILLQPNLSTTALCGMLIWLIAMAAGLPLYQLFGTAFGGMLLATLSIGLRSYQRKRVLSFLNPWEDPMGDGYQLVQSLLAIGSGGVWGTGFGMSQQKLSYLPIHNTDFIFAIYAEEFGLIGGFILLFMLIVYATLALRIAIRSSNIINRLVATGVMVLVVGQALLNIGVATGALPTTGLPLPFFSYGGNSMIGSLILAGLLIRVSRESNEAKIVSLAEHRAHRLN